MEERWRRVPDTRPKFTIDQCGDVARLLDVHVSLDDFQPSLPPIKFRHRGMPMDDDLAWRVTAMAHQLSISGSVTTTEWPSVRKEFTAESARAYIRDRFLVHVRTRRIAAAAAESAQEHENFREKKRMYIQAHADAEIVQEDFDLTSYNGKPSGGGEYSEVIEVFLKWVRTPRMLEFAAKMKLLDETEESYVPSKHYICTMVRAHEWITPELLSQIWPSHAAWVTRMWRRLQLELGRVPRRAKR
jgi:hypothetical protein